MKSDVLNTVGWNNKKGVLLKKIERDLRIDQFMAVISALLFIGVGVSLFFMGKSSQTDIDLILATLFTALFFAANFLLWYNSVLLTRRDRNIVILIEEVRKDVK